MKKIVLLAILVCFTVISLAKGNDRISFLLDKLKDGGKSNHVMIFAHRGDWKNAPENTLLAFQRCIDRGIDGIEIDVQITKDKHLVVFHDKVLNRVTNGKGNISDFTLEEIKRLNVKNGIGAITHHKIPTLAEVFDLCKGKILIQVDKWPPLKTEILKLAEEHNILNQLIFRSTKPAEEIKKEFGDYLYKVNYIPVIIANDNNDLAKIKDLEANLKFNVLGVSFNKEEYTLIKNLNKYSKKGYRIWANTFSPKFCAGHDDELALTDTKNSYGWLLKKGVSIIFTDSPFLLLDYLYKENRRDNAKI